METMTWKEYPCKDSSANTHSYKPGDVVRIYPTEWVSNGTGWVNTGKSLISNSGTPATVIGLDKQEEAALRETIACQKKEIEALQKALEVLIGVRDGESADTST